MTNLKKINLFSPTLLGENWIEAWLNLHFYMQTQLLSL